jgi:hypothetical protein
MNNTATRTARPNVDWTAPAVEVIDALTEIWFEAHPKADPDTAFEKAEAWADRMFHRYG